MADKDLDDLLDSVLDDFEEEDAPAPPRTGEATEPTTGQTDAQASAFSAAFDMLRQGVNDASDSPDSDESKLLAQLLKALGEDGDGDEDDEATAEEFAKMLREQFGMPEGGEDSNDAEAAVEKMMRALVGASLLKEPAQSVRDKLAAWIKERDAAGEEVEQRHREQLEGYEKILRVIAESERSNASGSADDDRADDSNTNDTKNDSNNEDDEFAHMPRVMMMLEQLQQVACLHVYVFFLPFTNALLSWAIYHKLSLMSCSRCVCSSIDLDSILTCACLWQELQALGVDDSDLMNDEGTFTLLVCPSACTFPFFVQAETAEQLRRLASEAGGMGEQLGAEDCRIM
ncbi:MAG: hypothetical protein MHM6MM_001365 [Cercozoa sp. M6MM]